MELKKQDILILALLIVLTFFFRLWRLSDFQYWSDDDQLFWLIVRHIVIDKHPSLVAPNVATNAALGPIFHYLSGVWLWLVNFDPLKIHIFGNAFAIASVITIFIAGKIIGGTRVGFVAGFLYATSFIASLFDRRFWPLSPNVFLVTLAVISLIKVVKGDSKYFIPLSLPIGFAFNSDPTLGVVIPPTIIVLASFRPKIQKRHFLVSLGIIFIFLLPILLFNIRHKGANIKSVTSFVAQETRSTETKVGWKTNLVYDQLQNFSRFFIVPATPNSDAYLCFCELSDHQTTALPLLVFLLFIGLCFLVAKEKNRTYLVLLYFIGTYFLGIIMFQEVLGGTPQFFHSLVILPTIFLVTALLIARNKFLLFPILLLYFLVNLQTLTKSSFKYPLSEKMELIEEVTKKLPDKDSFSLYYSGDVLLAGGGWTSLFISREYVPGTGSLYQYWGHPFEAYGLYPKPFPNGEQETVVVLSENPTIVRANKTIDIIKNGNVYAIIYNNEGKWFDANRDVEKLYQPKYFD